jgi:hypothetical protein
LKRQGSRISRALAANLSVAVVSLKLVACSGNTHCDPAYVSLKVNVPGGRTSIGSFQLTGACGGSGTPDKCQPVDCTRDAGECPCVISVVGIMPLPGSTTCHIEVVSADGAVFNVDVEVDNSGGGCVGSRLVDPRQQEITVEFDGVSDGGTADTVH